jgi:manganese/iron transport system ATP-binding protein/manganese/zinc/iron transport system ATP- binding protein
MGTYRRTKWYRRVSQSDRKAAEAALTRVGLEGEKKTLFGALSGGQRQRVLIARALVQDAKILLLDEPLTGVDAPSAERIEKLLVELRIEGRVALVATHDIHEARRFDKVLCLNKRQVAFGSAADVLKQEVLQATYGEELVILDQGTTAVAIQHHDH